MAGYKSPHERAKEAEADAAEVARAAHERAEARKMRENNWVWEKFMILGFSETGADLLASWRADHHRVKRMLDQGATREQIMTIFQPDTLPSSEEASA